MKVSVIKVGGNVIDNPEILSEFLTIFSKIKGPKVLVHGGGKIATALSKKMGIEPQMVNGRRITDKDSLEIVTMVYGGLINKNIVAQLQATGTNAIGLTGADGNLIEAYKRPVKDVDYGFVGDIERVNPEVLIALLKDDINPVIAPLTHDGKGQLLNTNADTIASAIAVGLSHVMDVELIYCFELKGVLKDFNDKDSVIPSISLADYPTLIENKIIADGMIPKIDNCFDAINAGVSQVRICHALELDHLEKGNIGTVFRK